jgi:hypothetical protein
VDQVIINTKNKTFYIISRGIFTDLKQVSQFALSTEKIRDIKTLFLATKPRVNGTWPKNYNHKKLSSLDGKIWKSEDQIRNHVETQWNITIQDFREVKSVDDVLS